MVVTLGFLAAGWAAPTLAQSVADSQQSRRAVTRTVAAVGHEWVRMSEFSPELIRAVLVAEDVNFFVHEGFEQRPSVEVDRPADATWERPGAGPTITQQLARMLWPQPAGNPFRWARLTLLTNELERCLTKEEILEVYLNLAKFGPRLFGAAAAARHYYGLSASEVGRLEAAHLACLLPAPTRWKPDGLSRRYRSRVARTLKRMQAETLPGMHLVTAAAIAVGADSIGPVPEDVPVVSVSLLR